MEVYDIVMIVVFAGAILFGAWKGLAWQIASLAAIFVSYFVALRFRGEVAQFISADPPWNRFLAMFILYLATSLVIWVAFGFVRRFIEQFQLKSFDRQAGAVVGALKGALLCALITLFAVTLLSDRQKEAILHSKSGTYIATAINKMSVAVPDELHQVLDPYLNRFNQEVIKHGTQPPQPNPADPGATFAGNNTPLEYHGEVTRSGPAQSEPEWLYNSETGQWERNPYAMPSQYGPPNAGGTRVGSSGQSPSLPAIDWERAAGVIFDAARKNNNNERQ